MPETGPRIASTGSERKEQAHARISPARFSDSRERSLRAAGRTGTGRRRWRQWGRGLLHAAAHLLQSWRRTFGEYPEHQHPWRRHQYRRECLEPGQCGHQCDDQCRRLVQCQRLGAGGRGGRCGDLHRRRLLHADDRAAGGDGDHRPQRGRARGRGRIRILRGRALALGRGMARRPRRLRRRWRHAPSRLARR